MKESKTILAIEDGTFNESVAADIFKDGNTDKKIILLVDGYKKNTLGFVICPENEEEVNSIIDALIRYKKEHFNHNPHA